MTLSVEGSQSGDISFSEPGRHIVRISQLPPHIGFDEFASRRVTIGLCVDLPGVKPLCGEFATIKKSADFVGECYLTGVGNLQAKE